MASRADLRFDIAFDADTRKAAAQIGSFARDIRTQITTAIKSLPDIELKAGQSDVERKLALIRNQLERLSDKRVGVDIDATAAQAEIRRIEGNLKDLAATKPSVQVEADIAKALAALKTIDGEADRLDGRKVTINVDVDRKNLGDAIRDMGLLASSLKSLAVPSALITAAPQIASLGSAAVTTAGALYLLPAAGFAAAAAIGTLVVGMQGFGDAMKDRGDAEKFAEDLKQLAPNAQAAAKQIQSLGPAWKSMQLDVQQKLFAGVSSEIKQLSTAYLPVLKSGLGGIAVELNAGARNFADWAKSADTVRDTATIFDNVRVAMHELVPAGTNVAATLKDIAVVGSGFLPELASGFTDVTGRLREFIAQARESGQLAVWIQNGLDKLRQLGQIAVNVGGILGSLFSAADASGAGFLTTLENATGKIREFLASAQGQQVLVDIFATIGQAVAVAGKALSSMGTVLGPVVSGLAAAAQAVLAVLDALGPLPGLLLGVVAAWKLFGVASAAITGLGTKLGAVAIGAGVFAEKMGASAKTVDGFAAAGAKAESGLSKIGGALPVLAAAFFVVSQAVDEATGDVAGWAQGLIQGGDAATKASAAIQEHNDHFREGSILGDMFRTTESEITAEIEKQVAAMGPLEQAQARAHLAQTAYNDAVRQFGVDSPQAVMAQQALATATSNYKAAQTDAEAATRSTTGALLDQQNQLLAGIDADLAAQSAVLRVKDAQNAYNDAVRGHGAASAEAQKAAIALDQAILNAITTAGAAAAKQAELRGETDTTSAALVGEAQAALSLAAGMSGPLPPALEKVISGMDATTLAAAGATAHIDATGHAVLVLPDGRVITLKDNGPEAQKRVDAVNAAIKALHDKQVTIDILQKFKSTGPVYGSVQGGGGITPGGLPGLNLPGLAGGGVVHAKQGTILAGYAPGQDRVPAMLSPGEAVLVPELVRQIGPENIMAANAQASGRPGTVMVPMAGFAGGGVTAGGRTGASGGGTAGGTTPDADFTKLQEGAQTTSEVVQALVADALAPLNDELQTKLMPTLVQVGELAAGPTTAGIGTLTQSLPPLLQEFLNAAASGQATWQQIAAAVQTSVSQQMGQHATLGSGLTGVNQAQAATAAATGSSWAQGGAAVAGSVAGQQAQFGALQGGLGAVNTAMANTAASTASSFAQVQTNTGNPIRWVLNNPFNAGLIAAWNRINDFFSLGRSMGPVPVGFAFGGRVPGTGIGDIVPAMLEPGEFVVSKSAAASVGLDNLDRWHRAATGGSRGDISEGMFAGYATGGPVVGASVGAGQAFARAQSGKPYIWGGVGPGGYDCSGFQSAITNVLLGRNPYSRIGATGSMPWPGFTPGLTSAYGVGWFNGSPGHTAGTLGGLNVESGGSHGNVMAGGSAAGATSGQFSNHMSLPQVGGVFIGGDFDPKAYVENEFKAAKAMARNVVPTFGGGNPAFGGQGGSIMSVDQAVLAAVKALTGATSFDTGGLLPPGGLGVNLSGHPERVLSPQETRGFHGLVEAVSTRRGAPGTVGGRPSVSLQVSGVEARLDRVVDTLERKALGGDTYQISGGGNPEATARAVTLRKRSL